MEISPGELRKLSNLELSRYAGEIDAIEGADEGIVQLLADSPVEVIMAAGREVCDKELYDIALEIQGRHETFVELRTEVIEDLNIEKRLSILEGKINIIEKRKW